MSAWVLLITVCIKSHCYVSMYDHTFRGKDHTACNKIDKESLEYITMKYHSKPFDETHFKCVQASTKINAWK